MRTTSLLCFHFHSESYCLRINVVRTDETCKLPIERRLIAFVQLLRMKRTLYFVSRCDILFYNHRIGIERTNIQRLSSHLHLLKWQRKVNVLICKQLWRLPWSQASRFLQSCSYPQHFHAKSHRIKLSLNAVEILNTLILIFHWASIFKRISFT